MLYRRTIRERFIHRRLQYDLFAATQAGVVLGMAAGYLGGAVDTLISRVIDIILSMPLLLFAVGIVAACSATATGCLGGLIQQGKLLVALVIAIFTWPYIARIVRGNTLSIREKEFIEASRSLGAGNIRIMFREVLPNLVAPIIVYTTLIIPNNVLFEAGLSFLGLGVPQDTPSWGRMLSDARHYLREAWWTVLSPGMAISLIVMAANFLGDSLRDRLDPTLRGKPCWERGGGQDAPFPLVCAWLCRRAAS